MPSESTFGILMCTYNGEAYLQAQLDSIAKQSVPFDEMVIIDDGSTDSTISIIHEWIKKSPNTRLIQRTKNVGASLNFQYGMQEMTTDWVFLCDQDDIWHPQKIKIFKESTLNSPSAKLFYSNANLIDEQDKPLAVDLWSSTRFGAKERALFCQDPLYKVILHPVVVGMSAMIDRKSALKLPIEADILHDEWYSFNFAKSRQIALISAKLTHYRQHSKQVTGVQNLHFWHKIKKSLFTHNTAPKRDLQRAEWIQSWLKSQNLSDYELLSQKQVSHLRVRCFSSKRNLYSLVFELLNGNYFKFSAGVMSFIKDVCRSVSI